MKSHRYKFIRPGMVLPMGKLLRIGMLLALLAAVIAASVWAVYLARYAKAEEQYQAAFQFEHRGDVTNQFAALGRAVRLNPHYLRTYFNLGRFYANHSTNTAAAMAAFAYPIRYKPESAEAAACRGFVLRRMGQPDAAMTNYERAVALDPDNAEAWYSLGSLAITMKQLDRGVDANLRALRLDPDYSDAWRNLAEGYHQLGRTTEALATGRKALAIDPIRIEFLINFASHMDHANSGEAATAYRKAVALDPDNISLRIAYAHFLFSRREEGGGLHELLEAARIDTNAVEPHAELAEFHYERFNHEEAEREYQWLVDHFPRDAALRGRLAEVSSVKWRKDSLKASLQNDVNRGRNSAEAHQALGNMRIRKGENEEGIKELREAVRLKPDNATMRCDLGRALKQFALSVAAEEQFLEAIRLDPRDFNAYEELTQVYELQRDLDRITAHCQRIADQFGDTSPRTQWARRCRENVVRLPAKSREMIVFTNSGGNVFRYGLAGKPRSDIISIGAKVGHYDNDLLRYAELCMARNEPAWAALCFEHILRGGEKNRDAKCRATYTLAEIYRADGCVAEGLELYNNLLAKYPDDAEIRAKADQYRAAMSSPAPAAP
jgi:tetratricopeptide (TPR) repeat protein